jgi:hypothetical protein
LGPFKAQLYGIPEKARARVIEAWEAQFGQLFDLLGMKDTRRYVETFIHPVKIQPTMHSEPGQQATGVGASDLQD